MKYRQRVKYGLDYFLNHFWTILMGGKTPLVLREGWVESISTVGGRVLLLREG